MQYSDKNGNEIKAGMTIRIEDGSLELVYATEDGYGDPDLGINATNKDFLKYHPNWEREFYSLSMFNLEEAEISPMDTDLRCNVLYISCYNHLKNRFAL